MGSKWKLILLIIALLIIVGGGAYYFGVKQNYKSIVQNQQKQIIPTITQPIPTSTLAFNPTANWKTYVSSDNYSMRYPPNWIVGETFKGSGIISISNPTSVKTFGQNGGSKINEATHFVTIVSASPSSKTAFQVASEFQAEWKKTAPNINIKIYPQIQHNDLSYVYYEAAGACNGYCGPYLNIAISDGKMLAELVASVRQPDDNSIENQILSTFKFTNQ